MPDPVAPPDYVSLKGRSVYLPEDATPALTDECTGCGADNASPRRIQPGPFGMFGKPKVARPAVRIALCEVCHKEQARGRYPWVPIALVWTAAGAVPTAAAVIKGQNAPVYTAVYLLNVVVIAVLYRWFNAPVYVAYRRHRSELQFRFQRPHRARPFARANGWARA